MSFTSKPLEECDAKQIREWLPDHHHTVEYNPGKYVLKAKYGEILQDILDFDVRKDDVFVASYPRTGSNWCQEIVWLIVNNLDFETARKIPQLMRAPLIGLTGFNDRMNDGDSVGYVRNMELPRCIKAHEPYDLLPKKIETVKAKLICIMRNPKDVYCSYYALLTSFMEMKGTFREAAEFFCRGKMMCGDYLDHCLSYWKKRHDSNVFLLTYEGLLADTKKSIRDIATFLERPLTEEQIEMICDFVKFENMKKNPGVNIDLQVDSSKEQGPIERKGEESFLRKGKSGDWKEKMSPEMSKMFDEWVARKTNGTDFTFNFDRN